MADLDKEIWSVVDASGLKEKDNTRWIPSSTQWETRQTTTSSLQLTVEQQKDYEEVKKAFDKHCP